MTEEEINKEARKYAQPYFDEAFKHTTPSVSAICEHEGKYIIDAFKTGAKLVKENQWISVKDRLPKVNGNNESDIVFVRNGKNLPFTALYDNNYNGKWRCNGDEFTDITHWMPIPKLNEE